MRILLTTRGSAGHLLPLAPVAAACARAGHEVLVTAQEAHRANVERAGLPFAPVPGPAAEDWMPLMDGFARLGFDEANAAMIGSFFGGLDTRAALPDLLGVVDRWRPDVMVRESWEFASTIAAEVRGVPLARVGLGLRSVEALSIDLVAPVLDPIRADAGLPPDPDGERLREPPYITAMPELIDDDPCPIASSVHRYRAPAAAAAAPPPERVTDEPLVYVSFGSVAADGHLPYFPALYRSAIAALAPLPARVLVTTGAGGDPVALGPLPPNVRAERWVPQEEILPRAAAMVCHGGYGSTLGALAHGVPLVVLPLFSVDQWANAEAVDRAGAGVALARGRSRRVLELPPDEEVDALAGAVRRVLDDPGYGRTAEAAADAIRRLAPVDAAVDLLAGLAAGGRR